MIDQIILTRADNGWTITVTEEPVAPERADEPVQFPMTKDPILVEGGENELLTALADVLADYGDGEPVDKTLLSGTPITRVTTRAGRETSHSWL